MPKITKPYRVSGSIMVGTTQYNNCVAYLTDEQAHPYLTQERFKGRLTPLEAAKPAEPINPKTSKETETK